MFVDSDDYFSYAEVKDATLHSVVSRALDDMTKNIENETGSFKQIIGVSEPEDLTKEYETKYPNVLEQCYKDITNSKTYIEMSAAEEKFVTKYEVVKYKKRLDELKELLSGRELEALVNLWYDDYEVSEDTADELYDYVRSWLDMKISEKFDKFVEYIDNLERKGRITHDENYELYNMVLDMINEVE